MASWKERGGEAKVTVRCATYNHEPYIKDALHGFLSQKTNFRYKIVVHDDASTDGTADIVADYAKRYPRLIFPILQKQNLRSRGISRKQFVDPLLEGPYVAICEGDDYWIARDKLQRQVDFLDQNPEYSMVFHSAIELNETCGTSKVFSVVENRQYLGEEFLRKWLIPTASVVYRKAMLRHDLYEGKPFFGDIVLFLKLAAGGFVWGMSQEMSVYRRHPTGLTRTNKSMDPVHRIDRLLHHWESIGAGFGKRYREISRQNMARLFRHKASELRKRKDAGFVVCLFRSFVHDARGSCRHYLTKSPCR